MKVSIFGTNGFLSTAIAKYCNQKGYPIDIYGLDEPKTYSYNTFSKINLMQENLDYDKLSDSDLIIYAIGAGIQSNLKEKSDSIYHLNVTVPVKICTELKVNSYKGRLVTFGSVFEMGETSQRHFFTEEEIMASNAPAPNDYTVSKRMLTRFVSSYKHEFIHWHFVIPTIYGEMENPLRLIPYTINAIHKGETLHFTSGEQIRQYIHVNDVVRLIDIAYKKNLPDGMYNIQGRETLSVYEIVSTIHKVLGKTVPENCFGSTKRADIGMKYLALNGTKLKQATGFEPFIELAKVIKNY